MRYFIRLAYNGAEFHGWQSQPNAISVQQTIEKALSTLLRQETLITGAGRTDTGVHARTMYAHFDTEKSIEDKNRFILSLNKLIGKNITVYDIVPVIENAHARFDAKKRTYKYFVSYNDNPFFKDFFWKSPSFLNIDYMNEAASLLLQTSDFTSFAKLHTDVRTNICKVSEAKWSPISGDSEALAFLGNLQDGFVFTISADRFLRNMVRAIVGTLVEVGRGKLSIEGFVDIINEKNRCKAGTSMPAEALFLWDIEYPWALISK